MAIIAVQSLFIAPFPLDFEFLGGGMPQDTPEGSRIWCWLLRPLPLPTTPHHRHRCRLFFWRKCQLGKKLFSLRMAKVHQEETSYVLIDWMGGPDGKICGSRSGQHQMCVLAESQILSGPALPTIDDTQLGSHCSDTCLCLFQCCFEMAFWWTCPSSRPTLEGKGKRGSSTTCQRYSSNWSKF